MLATTRKTKAAGLNLYYSIEYNIPTNNIIEITVEYPSAECSLIFSSDLELIGISTQRATFVDKDTLSNFKDVAKEALEIFKKEFIK